MSDPSTLDSTGLPSWMSLSTDDLPDTVRSRLQSTTSTLIPISKTSVTATPATASAASTSLHAGISTSSYGSASSGPTGFDSNGGVTVSSGSTSESGDSGSSSSTPSALILGVSIPIGVLLVVVLLISGIIIGKRMARPYAPGWGERPSKRWWTFWRRRGGHVQLEDQEGLGVRQERCELSGEHFVRELPTNVNIQEMEERRELVELPVPSPPGSLRSVRGGGDRGT